MSEAAKSLEELIQELPPELRAEVRDFIESLLAKRDHRAGNALRQDWAGALREQRERYTSLILQHQALVWRGD